MEDAFVAILRSGTLVYVTLAGVLPSAPASGISASRG
jgi:hypothetical protein